MAAGVGVSSCDEDDNDVGPAAGRDASVIGRSPGFSVFLPPSMGPRLGSNSPKPDAKMGTDGFLWPINCKYNTQN